MMVFIESQTSRPTLSFVSLASDTESQQCINEFNCRCQDIAYEHRRP